MKFVFKKGLIWISVAVVYEGNRITVENCIFDTGSATTAIDIEQLHINYAIPAKIKRLFGVGDGTQDVICQRVETLCIGDAMISDIEIEFGDLKGRLGIGGFIVASIFGYTIGLKRLYAYGLLALVLFTTVHFIEFPFEYILLTLGLVIIVWGSILLMQFTRKYPITNGE